MQKQPAKLLLSPLFAAGVVSKPILLRGIQGGRG